MFSFGKIKKWLRRHPRVDFIQYSMRFILPKKEECKKHLDYEKNYLNVHFEHLGDLNKGKVFYIIDIPKCWHKSGYCHLLRMTIYFISYAEMFGFIPVIRWSEELLYSEKEKINDTYNSFEYFWMNTYDIDDESLYKSNLVVWCKPNDVDYVLPEDFYHISEDEHSVLINTIKKYLRLNDYGKKEIIDAIDSRILDGGVLGVHIRRTDYSKNYDGHPIEIQNEKYIENINNLLNSGKYKYIFLATDDQNTLEYFVKIYGDKIIYNDVLRSANGEAVHYEYKSERNNNNYYLGKELLWDLFSIIHCDGFIGTVSNVSMISRAIKEAKNEEYKDVIILDDGINRNLKNFVIMNVK